MESERFRWTVAVRSVLLALVLAAQASTMAHAFEHDASGADTLCATCSAGYAQQAAIVDSGSFTQLAPVSTVPFDSDLPNVFPARLHTSQARAPPPSL